MKICLIHEEYPEETNFGGIATYQKNLAEEFVKMGNKVIVICRGLEKDYTYEEQGVKIYRIFVKKTENQVKDYVLYRKKVSALLQKLQDANLIDIIEVPDWGAETYFFEKYRKIPLIVRLHTPLKVWLKYNKNDFGKVKDNMLYWEEKMLKSADLLTCCSHALKKIIVKEFEIDNDKIIVTPNPANVINFYRNKNVKKEDRLLYVGSLEERKGVCVLAKALNSVFEQYPNLSIDFIGKDTSRNSKNISTVELIKKQVSKKYHKNLNFYGHIPNSELNKYFNRSLIGIFPSLFDNFPYVVLEAMATGLHIVGSRNSGMVEMLNDDNSIYETGNPKDLSKKIINKYQEALKNDISIKNMNRLLKEYNPTKVCLELKQIYIDVIRKFYIKTSKEELQKVLNKVTTEKIIKYSREKKGIANEVYKITTTNNIYVIKKYIFDYDFNLSNELYDIYEQNKVKVIKPINGKIIKINGYNFNIFRYFQNSKEKDMNLDFYVNLITCDRSFQNSNYITLNEKLDKYYLYLSNQKPSKILEDDVIYVMSVYKKLKKLKFILENKYLNHGDLSQENILSNENEKFIIDFDEVCISFELYDFAVIAVKNFLNNEKTDKPKYLNFETKIGKYYTKYDESEIKNSIKYYLCKILLEKFYFHEMGIIDLFSNSQRKDYYKKYVESLKNIYGK